MATWNNESITDFMRCVFVSVEDNSDLWKPEHRALFVGVDSFDLSSDGIEIRYADGRRAKIHATFQDATP